jgi:aldose 1-epimerase
MSQSPVLRRGDLRLELLPWVGGAVRSFAFRGHDLLRPATPGADDPLQTALFVMLPFANRIAHGVFRFEGSETHLARGRADPLHALHGHGWLKPWTVAALGEDRATLTFTHDRDDWPWSYAAQQIVVLTQDGLRIELSLINRDSNPMPYSMGFHPYFPKTVKTRLTAKADGVWLSDDTLIPTRHAEPSHFLDLAHGALLAEAPFVDHCQTGWNREVTIDQPDLGLEVTLSASEALGFLHLYLPRDQPFFCAEPVSAMPDAFNHPEPSNGLRVLAPGRMAHVSMTLTVRERGSSNGKGLNNDR